MSMGRRSLLRAAALSFLVVCQRARAGIARSALAALRASLKGRLLGPADASFDEARRVASFNPTTDKRPSLIVQCASRDDVARAIEFARTASLEIAVKSGGHDVLGESVTSGGLMIDMSAMKEIVVDEKGTSAHVQAGVRSGEFSREAGRFDLAPVLGCNPVVGVAGLTLGGGLGWLLGTKGAACDNLIGADVVTADGRFLTTSRDENPDLFWALHGGGGNFGVVVDFQYRLHSLSKVLAGVVGFHADLGKFLTFYRDFMAQAPDALTVELNIMDNDPPLILAIVCWSGEAPEGEQVLKPLRFFEGVAFDHIREVSYGDATGPNSGGPLPRNLHWRGGTFDHLNDTIIDTLVESTKVAPAGWNIGLGHYMHGEICRITPDSTPLVRRAGQFSYFIGAGWGDGMNGTSVMRWVDLAFAAVRGLSSDAPYINYLSDDSEAAVRAAYGVGNYSRLQSLKKKYDPDNVFHLNRNIRPRR
jgi:FAD/FMN-containing dehydrogenase